LSSYFNREIAAAAVVIVVGLIFYLFFLSGLNRKEILPIHIVDLEESSRGDLRIPNTSKVLYPIFPTRYN
jgi:hypothetical protein